MIRVAAGILIHGGGILICQRRAGGPFPLKWEFPGGKLKEGESAVAALSRELREELGIIIQPARLREVEKIHHRYPEGPEVEVHFFATSEFEGQPVNLAFEKIAWVTPPDLLRFDFLEADGPLVARIAAGGVLCSD